MPITPPPDAPFLNRLVHAMFEHADPRADQNIWDLARAAEEVIREVKGEQLTAAYGGPLGVGWRRGDGGRVQMSPMPLTQVARDYSQPEARSNVPDYAAQLGEVERRLMLKAPQYSGDTATKVDALAQDYQAASQRAVHAEKLLRDLAHKVSPKKPITAEKVMGAAQGLVANHQAALREIEQLRGKVTELAGFKDKVAVAQDVISQIRGALDPDGQFEDESLPVLARERMSQRAARGQEIKGLQAELATRGAQGTLFEEASAERMRKLLGATERESLAAAAIRVKGDSEAGWNRAREAEQQFKSLDEKIRKLVRAQPEVDDWDNPCNEQPTLDAVARVIKALIATDSRVDGSMTQDELLDEVQQTWHTEGHKEIEL